jgi:hypothetical protein
MVGAAASNAGNIVISLAFCIAIVKLLAISCTVLQELGFATPKHMSTAGREVQRCHAMMAIGQEAMNAG